MSSDTGVWAYAITSRDDAVDLSWLAGVGGAKVRTAACSGLTMLVSDVSLAEFGEAALRENLENLDWLDERAQEHHYVIDAAARLFPLLPVRLATVYSGDAAVCAALTANGAQLRGALRRVGGRVEWGVKAYAVPESETPAHRPDEGGSDQADSHTGSGAGLAYLRRRREQLTAGRESRTAAVDAARAVFGALAGQAERARLHPPQSPQLSGVRLPMLLNAAYLLAADGAADFKAAVAAQATAHPELRIDMTGPWPPYSFAADDYDNDRH